MYSNKGNVQLDKGLKYKYIGHGGLGTCTYIVIHNAGSAIITLPLVDILIHFKRVGAWDYEFQYVNGLVNEDYLQHL